MPDQERIAETLRTWIELLESFAAVQVDVDATPETIESALLERQNFITQLQEIDASLREIAAQRRQNWAGLELADPGVLENLVALGTAWLDKISDSDSLSIEKAKGKRIELLGQLKAHSLGQNYSASQNPSPDGPPIIVDSKL